MGHTVFICHSSKDKLVADAACAALYGAAILWDLGFDTIYAHQDREDDALVGVKHSRTLFVAAQARIGGVLFADRLSMIT